MHLASAMLAALAVLAAAPARAEVLVETDPSTFVLGGFAAHVRAAPASTPRWTYGLGVYALDLPAPMVDLDAADRGHGWSVRYRLAYGVFVDRYLGARRDAGPFVGLQLALHHVRAARPGERDLFVDGLAMPRLGYTWFPGVGQLYVMGWLGVGATAPLAGQTGTYDVFPVIAFGAIHVGWRFR
jgi:hypothetical protein